MHAKYACLFVGLCFCVLVNGAVRSRAHETCAMSFVRVMNVEQWGRFWVGAVHAKCTCKLCLLSVCFLW